MYTFAIKCFDHRLIQYDFIKVFYLDRTFSFNKLFNSKRTLHKMLQKKKLQGEMLKCVQTNITHIKSF